MVTNQNKRPRHGRIFQIGSIFTPNFGTSRGQWLYSILMICLPMIPLILVISQFGHTFSTSTVRK